MQPSTHKNIVRGACGCGAAGAVLTVVVWILILNYARSPEVADAVHREAAAALDTLVLEGWPATTVVFDPDGFALPDPAATAVLGLVGRLWNDTASPPPWIPLGDTFPAGAGARRRWLMAANHPAVDSLLALRTRVARSGKVSQVAQGRAAVLYQARAVLARARRSADSGQVDVAEWLLGAVVTVGHDMQSGPSLLRAITGVRLERDALHMLAQLVPAARAKAVARGAERADSMFYGLLGVRARLQLVARDTTRLDTLAAWARDPTLPLPLRDNCIRGIGLGWMDHETELLGGVAARRDSVLARLEDSLPVALEPALRFARRFASPGWVQRMALAAQYEDITAPLVTP
ncbi:MAG: hypothetical protein ACREMW_01265 [Gemmatimonadales bacterium]